MVVVGLVVGLGGTFGWNGWQAWQANQAESASVTYQALLAAATRNQFEQIEELGAALVENHPGSRYASLAALVMAKGAVAQDRPEDATRRLQWVLENGSEEEVKQIAQLRLAQLAMDREDYEGALAMLERVQLPGLVAAVQELRGDIAVARDDRAAARSAYEEALAAEDLPQDVRARINIKLDDLGHYNIPPAGTS